MLTNNAVVRRLKQYFKEGRGCRTERTFRNAGDFGANKGSAICRICSGQDPTPMGAPVQPRNEGGFGWLTKWRSKRKG
jgi:hypothetical protein